MSLCNCSKLTFTYNNLNCKGYTNVPKLYGLNGLLVKNIDNKINNLVMMPSSLNTDKINSKTIGCSLKKKCTLQEPFTSFNLSDQVILSKSKATVPTRGNSQKSTITSLRPGAMTPGGEGVDIKHGSYARYLALKKGYFK